MRKKASKEILEKIDNFFKKALEVSKVSEEEARKLVKKARRLAEKHNISLKNYNRVFCRKCNTYFKAGNFKVRLSHGKISIRCLRCGSYRRFKIKS